MRQDKRNPDFEPRCTSDGKGGFGRDFWIASVGALGVVYGDIGTSPLYALQETAKEMGGGAIPGIYGAASLIFWTLTLIVTCKYTLEVLRGYC